jgi:hypothetical protein
MHTRLAQALQGYIATVRTSYQGYQDSDLWANPTLTPTWAPAYDNAAQRLMQDAPAFAMSARMR